MLCCSTLSTCIMFFKGKQTIYTYKMFWRFFLLIIFSYFRFVESFALYFFFFTLTIFLNFIHCGFFLFFILSRTPSAAHSWSPEGSGSTVVAVSWRGTTHRILTVRFLKEKDPDSSIFLYVTSYSNNKVFKTKRSWK